MCPSRNGTRSFQRDGIRFHSTWENCGNSNQKFRGCLIYVSFESCLFIPDMSPSKSVHRDHHNSSEKRDGNHTESRNSFNDQRIGENDRGHQVVKTCSVHTTALPTVVYRLVTKIHLLPCHWKGKCTHVRHLTLVSSQNLAILFNTSIYSKFLRVNWSRFFCVDEFF